MNFRINLPYFSVTDTLDEMTSTSRDQDMHLLLNNDQLNQLKAEYSWLYNFKEMPISFFPTYKYDKNSTVYDTSKKQRVPSWTDRILWYHDQEKTKDEASKYMTPVLYERRESLFSDHRPVAAYFEINVHKHDEERKFTHKKTILDRSSTSFIDKKPIFEQVEVKTMKVDNGFEFDYFEETKGKNQVPIHLELGPKKPNSQHKPSNKKNMIVDDLVDFGNDGNLIDIKEKSNTNLVDFGSSNSTQPNFATNTGHMFHPMHPHSNSMGIRARPIAGMHNNNMFNNPPAPAFQPMHNFNTVSGNRHRASVPRKQSKDLIERAQSTNLPQKSKMLSTEDYFNF